MSAPYSLPEVIAALRWQQAFGVDEGLEELPTALAPPVWPELIKPATAGEGQRKGEAAATPLRKAAVPVPLPPPKPVVRQDFSKITTLEALKAALDEITHLNIRQTAMNMVFGEGALNPDIMFIGEAPGEEEDRTGQPFVGRAGQLLNKILQSIGQPRESVYITNVLPWRPPGNREPNVDEVATCLPYLRHHIALVKPRCLVLLGGAAGQAVLGKKESVGRLRNHWWETSIAADSPPIPTLVTYHPAYLLRTPLQKKEAWKDFLTLVHNLSLLKKQD